MTGCIVDILMAHRFTYLHQRYSDFIDALSRMNDMCPFYTSGMTEADECLCQFVGARKTLLVLLRFHLLGCSILR